jgi:hypothetical protein
MAPSAAGSGGFEPVAGRPDMPGYGVPDDEDGLLPWAWAVERLERAHNYWVATATPEGVPHLAAVWGVWVDTAFHFSTGGRSRKARDLLANPSCVVTPDDATESVVVQGVAERITDAGALASLLAAYRRKYGSGFPDPVDNPVFAVRPRTAIGIIEREAEFARTATRWTFPT